MADTTIHRPFRSTFISDFVWTPQTLPFSSEELASLDTQLAEFEQIYLNPDIEKNLISKNELLTSFAISKAEDSQLTLQEARDVYELIESNPNLNFIKEKLQSKKKLTQKDHDKLEFFNILKTFRSVNQTVLTVDDLSPAKIRELHASLTQGLDIFKNYQSNFTVYKSGTWRDNDLIRVGNYAPAPHEAIGVGVTELISWLKLNQTISGVAVFHTALYGLHPFNNGNKRVCRILEHLLLRSLGINKKNLFSTSYYYHKQKERYYKYLLFSLERRNLNHFVSFVQEALLMAIIDVVKSSLEAKRSEFLIKHDVDSQMMLVLRPLIKRNELQFKNLARITRNKVARQTLVTYLSKAVDLAILRKRASGRSTYYGLNFDAPEMEILQKWLKLASDRLSFVPDSMRLV